VAVPSAGDRGWYVFSGHPTPPHRYFVIPSGFLQVWSVLAPTAGDRGMRVVISGTRPMSDAESASWRRLLQEPLDGLRLDVEFAVVSTHLYGDAEGLVFQPDRQGPPACDSKLNLPFPCSANSTLCSRCSYPASVVAGTSLGPEDAETWGERFTSEYPHFFVGTLQPL